MSASNSQTVPVIDLVPVIETVPVPVIAKKPSLPSKLEKFMVFGFSFVNTLATNGVINSEQLDTILQDLKIFSSVQEQTIYYENFLDNSKQTTKDLRKLIVQKNKPPKAPKAPKEPKVKAPKEPKVKVPKEPKVKVPKEPKVKVPKEPKVKVTKEPVTIQPVVIDEPNNINIVITPELVTETVTETLTSDTKKNRKPRVKKTVVVANDTSDDLIGKILAAANVQTVQNEVKPEAKKEKKEKKEKAKKTQVVDTQTIVEVNPVIDIPTASTPPLEEDDADEIQTREFNYNGSLYLIDADNNLYDPVTFLDIGVFDNQNNKIVIKQ
jgi:hypothetical protein